MLMRLAGALEATPQMAARSRFSLVTINGEVPMDRAPLISDAARFSCTNQAEASEQEAMT